MKWILHTLANIEAGKRTIKACDLKIMKMIIKKILKTDYEFFSKD